MLFPASALTAALVLFLFRASTLGTNRVQLLLVQLLLVLVQLFIKGINFGLGVLVVRATGAKLYGVAAVPIALLLSTVLFLSREGVRMACARVDVRAHACRGSASRQRAQLAALVDASWATLPSAALVVAPTALGLARIGGGGAPDPTQRWKHTWST